MTKSTGKRRYHLKSVLRADRSIKAIGQWTPANRGFYIAFQAWLRAGGYGESALQIYGSVVRLALGLLDQPYWLIDPEADLDRVRTYIDAHFASEGTRTSYAHGLLKLAEFLRVHQHRPPRERTIHWVYHLTGLPPWLAEAVRAYVTHRQRAWRPEQQHQATNDLLSRLTLPLRGLVARGPLNAPAELTPPRWYEYVDMRLAAGIQPGTVNGELGVVQHLLQFLAEQGQPICERILQIEPFKVGPSLPRDVPVAQLRVLQQAIETAATSAHAGVRRMGVLDRAWFLLMLHSGLRTGEVRRLRMTDLDLEGRRVRIDQSKGLKDRIVCVSAATVAALRAYFEVRGMPENSLDCVFLYRHAALSPSYCEQRLMTYGKRCGVQITPHQWLIGHPLGLRHSCATLLLNAGAPVLTVQTILGHKHVDTTVGFLLIFLAHGAPALQTAHAADAILYVAPASVGSRDCSSWANACDLHTALANAVTDTVLWLQRCVSTAIRRLPRFHAVLKPLQLQPVVKRSS